MGRCRHEVPGCKDGARAGFPDHQHQGASTEASEGNSMATEVNLPALGESVTEGTVTRWLKNVGDTIAVDEPLLEVSTDKVDTEIPSPVAGTLLEIRANEDDTVEVGAVLAVVGAADEAGSAPAPDAAPESDAAPEESAQPEPVEQAARGRAAAEAPAPAG